MSSFTVSKRVRTQLALQVTPDLLARVKAAAASQGRTVTSLALQWLEEGLAGTSAPMIFDQNINATLSSLPDLPAPPNGSSEEGKIYHSFLTDIIVNAVEACRKLEALPRQQYKEELDKVTLEPGRMDRAKLLYIISEQLQVYTDGCHEYRLGNFRRHCEPHLKKYLCQNDLELDADSKPRWHERFNYAHKSIAELLGYVTADGKVYRLSQ